MTPWSLALAVLLSSLGAGAAKTPLVTSVGTIGITVSDLDRSVAFYRDVLSFSVAGETEASGPPVEQLEGVFGAHVRSARLQLGSEAIVLTQYLAPRGRAVPADMRSNDRAFQHIAIVVSDMDLAYRRLREHAVRHISNEPQTLPAWNKNAGGIKAFYFADPDDHALEVIWFPRGKGDPRWQRPGGATPPLFLGIDHTAIGVADTARSLRLYRDAFGLRVAGESENSGTEQEHLNAVFGAHLRITGLRAASGPGIELLEYLSPRDGRPAATDLRANDLSHWQTVLYTNGVAPAAVAASADGGVAVSATPVDLEDRATGIHRAALIRDPDGHGLLLAQ
jgi:catechol 2,3-dioxygenase-like lactoylglutathione lyase family enzyme